MLRLNLLLSPQVNDWQWEGQAGMVQDGGRCQAWPPQRDDASGQLDAHCNADALQGFGADSDDLSQDNYKENLGTLIRTIYDFAFVT